MKELREMTSKELKEIAKELKVKNWWNLKKAELIVEIEKIQNMSEEETAEREEEIEKENELFEHYQKHWAEYGPKNDFVKFLKKYKAGKIQLISEENPVEEEPIEEKPIEEEPVEEPTEVKPERPTKIKAIQNKDELIAKKNIENAYNWIIGGNDNAMIDGEMTQEEFDNWITNDAFNEILDEAMSSKYEPDCAGGEAPAAMKRVRKSILKGYLLGLFNADGYKINVEIKDQEGHKPTPKRGALIEFDGKAQNICAWGKELGISPNTLYGRIYKMGWSVERAFTTPSRKTK